MILKGSINITQLIVMNPFTTLPWSHVFFTPFYFNERCIAHNFWHPCWSWSFPVTHTYSESPGCFYWIMKLLLIGVCNPNTTKWTTGAYMVMLIRFSSKIFLKMSFSPYHNHLFSTTSGGWWARKKFKEIKHFLKVGFEKSNMRVPHQKLCERLDSCRHPRNGEKFSGRKRIVSLILHSL